MTTHNIYRMSVASVYPLYVIMKEIVNFYV